MIGGRPSFVLVNTLFVSMFLGCGDRRTEDASASDTTGTVAPADAATSRTDSTPAPTDSATVRRDSAPAPTPSASAEPAPRKPPVPKPAVPKPAPRTPPPAAPAPADAAPAATPAPAPPAAEPTDTPSGAEAGAPLRDAYHQAPLDTVSQQVYDGWKQYNLNCARCHGEDVMGTTIAPHLVTSLKPDGPINTKEMFMQVVCAGRPEKGMPAWCPLGLEMDKIEAIHSYVKGRSEGKIRPGRPALKSQG